MLPTSASLAGEEYDLCPEAAGDVLASGMTERDNLCSCAWTTDATKDGKAALNVVELEMLMLALNKLGPCRAVGLLLCKTGIAANSARRPRRATNTRRGARRRRRRARYFFSGGRRTAVAAVRGR